MRQYLLGLWALLLLVLAGCSTVPPTNIQQPMTARPSDRVITPPADGAIFHAGIKERPLFEDIRARNVGDILTVSIAERMIGSQSGAANSSSSSTTNMNLPTVNTNVTSSLISKIPLIGSPAAKVLNSLFGLTGSISGSSSTDAAKSSDGNASQSLTGTITVTVVEVLANGNLLVGGEKQVALNNTDEYIRFSGVVNPMTISNTNTVLSTQVADAHIEYKNAGAMNELKNDMLSLGFLGRFFLSVLAF